MNSMYKDYPFPVNEHIEFILEQLHTVHDEHGFFGTPFYVQAFSKDFPATLKSDNNVRTLIRCLDDDGLIEVCGKSETKKFKTPLVESPEFEGVFRYKVIIKKPDKIRRFYENISFRNHHYNLQEIQCQLIMSAVEDEDNIKDALKLFTTQETYELKVFGKTLSKYVFRDLINKHYVSRKDGKIKVDKYPWPKEIGKLNDLVSNVGFNKKMKEIFFNKCTANELSLNQWPVLTGREIDYVVSCFEDKRKKLKKRSLEKREIPDFKGVGFTF